MSEIDLLRALAQDCVARNDGPLSPKQAADLLVLLAEAHEQRLRAEWAIAKGINWREKAEKAKAERDEAREGRDAMREAYRAAVGVPPSEHQSRRMEEMAQEWERAKADAAHWQSEYDDLCAKYDALQQGIEALAEWTDTKATGLVPMDRLLALLAPDNPKESA